ncbi:MAG: CBS domain-containing protein [Bacteriovoracia bacterium]
METAREIMKKNPVTCYPDSSIQEVANLMIKFDCGEIPVIDRKSDVIAGVITDRDITVRTIGEGLNPLEMKTAEVMTVPAVTVTEDTPLERCIHLMERNRVRRIPVVDESDHIKGIISIEDIAARNEAYAAELMKEISKSKSISLQ